MAAKELNRDGYTISSDKLKLDINKIHEFLSQSSYWAQGRDISIVEQSIEGSLCFGVYKDDEQVGFARVVTDFATFGWLCDVFIIEEHRGRGLGKWLIDTVVSHDSLDKVRTLLLATRDAQELYRKYGGFKPLAKAEEWMIRRKGEE